jgi:hypothetical protein
VCCILRICVSSHSTHDEAPIGAIEDEVEAKQRFGLQSEAVIADLGQLIDLSVCLLMPICEWQSGAAYEPTQLYATPRQRYLTFLCPAVYLMPIRVLKSDGPGFPLHVFAFEHQGNIRLTIRSLIRVQPYTMLFPI